MILNTTNRRWRLDVKMKDVGEGEARFRKETIKSMEAGTDFQDEIYHLIWPLMIAAVGLRSVRIMGEKNNRRGD